MQGQANHFTRYAPLPMSNHAYSQSRYQNETRRLYRVLDTHLATGDRKFLVGDKCSIADITTWGWVSHAPWAGVDMGEFPALKAWEERLGERAVSFFIFFLFLFRFRLVAFARERGEGEGER